MAMGYEDWWGGRRIHVIDHGYKNWKNSWLRQKLKKEKRASNLDRKPHL
jgi:hypothetical protein